MTIWPDLTQKEQLLCLIKEAVDENISSTDLGINAVGAKSIRESAYPVLVLRGIVAVADEQLRLWYRMQDYSFYLCAAYNG